MRLPLGLLGLLAILSFPQQVLAQAAGEGSVSGRLIAKAAKGGLESANVTLLNRSDTTLVTSRITDKEGRFTFDGVRPGEYFVEASFIGYRSFRSRNFTIDAGHVRMDLGTVSMTASVFAMDEVVVNSEKQLFNYAIDRKVYNVDKDLMSKAGSANELLQNLPSVQVDIEGNVSLRGSSDVLILIDGRPSPLMGKSRADVLQQMPASAIEKIEVITNPSARFKPEGTSGIIDIIMKKGAKNGLNGAVTANAGADSRHNENLILNYNPGRINLRGSYGFRQDERHRFGKDERVQLDASSGLPSRYRDDSRSVARPRSHVGTLGIDYLMDERNSFELSGEYFYRKLTLHDVSTKVTRNSEGVITEDLDRLGVNTESERETGVTAAFQHKFPKEDHELRVEASASDAPEKEDSRYTDLFRVPEPEGGPQRDNTLVKTGEKQMRLAVDYANPLSERSKLEAGYAGELDEQDIDNHAEYFDAVQQRFVSDVGRTNRFRGDQIVHAVYGTFERAFGAISVLAGLRVEDASVKSHLVTTDSTITQNYLSLYPTLHLARKLGEAAEIQLNYSRRVNRPESDELNPFPEYTDPRNVRAGNPDLKPENIHSVEFGYQWRKESLSFSPSVYYRYKYNGFTSVTEALNDSTLLTTDKNLSSDQSAGLEFVVSASVANALTANLSTNTFYDRIDASNIGYSKKKAVVSGSGSLNVNFTPVRASMFQINTYYRSARLTPQGKYRPSMVLNAGFRQDMFEERVSLTLTASDIFKTQRHEIRLSIPGIEQHVTNRRDGRIFYCGAAYHFGRPEKKAKEKSLQYDDRMQ